MACPAFFSGGLPIIVEESSKFWLPEMAVHYNSLLRRDAVLYLHSSGIRIAAIRAGGATLGCSKNGPDVFRHGGRADHPPSSKWLRLRSIDPVG